MQTGPVHTLAEIGLKAIQLQERIDARKIEARRFGKACADWKRANGLTYIERHTDLWGEMLKGVRPAYLAILDAKDDETKARKRLERACRKVMKAE